MPIKYTLTKNDMLAEKIHNYALRCGSLDTKKDPGADDEYLKAKATIIASFASSLSWQTFKTLNNSVSMLGSPEIKNEYDLARSIRWKQIRSADIQEVASMNICERAFFSWLLFNVEKEERELYKKAWGSLRQEFAQECDDITNGKQ
jgi:hypothetical protein